MSLQESSTSVGLLRAAQDADAQAWERLRQLYAPLVYHWCYQSGISRHDADDVCQEVFTAVDRGLKGYDHQSKFRSWLRTITINKIRDFIRSSKLRPNAIGGSDARNNLERIAIFESLSEGTQDDEDILIEQVLSLLRDNVSTTTWQAFWRTAIDDAPTTIVAEELGISKGAVRQAKYRMLQRLRDEMAELEIEPKN